MVPLTSSETLPREARSDIAPDTDSSPVVFWVARVIFRWLVVKARYVPTEFGHMLTMYSPNLVFPSI